MRSAAAIFRSLLGHSVKTMAIYLEFHCRKGATSKSGQVDAEMDVWARRKFEVHDEIAQKAI